MSFPVYKRILSKLENFFVAGTRLTLNECEVELSIVECSLILMEDQSESFINVNFTELTNYFYNPKTKPEFLENSYIKKLLNT